LVQLLLIYAILKAVVSSDTFFIPGEASLSVAIIEKPTTATVGANQNNVLYLVLHWAEIHLQWAKEGGL
jgi:hypothetical protein